MVFLAIFWATAPLPRREKGWTAPMQPAHWEIHVIREQWETASAIKCYKDGYVSWIPHEVNSTWESRTPYARFYFGFDSCIIIWSKQKIAGFIYCHWLPFARKRIHGFLFSCNDGDGWTLWIAGSGTWKFPPKKVENLVGSVDAKGMNASSPNDFSSFFFDLGQDMFKTKTCFLYGYAVELFFFQNGPPKRLSI